MKLKRVTVMAFALAFLIAGITYAVGKRQEQTPAIIESHDGVLVELPSMAEKSRTFQSFDPITGSPKEETDYTEKNKQIQSTKIDFNHDGMETTFEFLYTTEGTKRTALNLEGAHRREYYTLDVIPGSNQFVMSYKSSAYLLDMDKKTIDSFMNDTYNEFSYSQLKKEGRASVEGLFDLHWVEDISVNNTGDTMIFETNRSELEGIINGVEMWIKDLRTGKERYLQKSTFTPVGWDDDNNFYYQDNDEGLCRINVNDGTVQVLDGGYIAALADPYLYTHHLNDTGKFSILDLASGEKIRTIEYKDMKNITRFKPNSVRNHKWVAIHYFSVSDGITKSIDKAALYSPETNTVHPLPSYVTGIVLDFSWQDESTLLVNTRELGTLKEATFFITMDEMEDQ